MAFLEFVVNEQSKSVFNSRDAACKHCENCTTDLIHPRQYWKCDTHTKHAIPIVAINQFKAITIVVLIQAITK